MKTSSGGFSLGVRLKSLGLLFMAGLEFTGAAFLYSGLVFVLNPGFYI